MPREEPFTHLVSFVRKRRADYAEDLTTGKWADEPAGRELVGRIAALDEIETEMRNISGPNTHFGESDL